MFPSLYAIADTETIARRGWAPFDVCRTWLSAGVRLIQLRAKSMSAGEFLELADALNTMCRASSAMLIVNDRVDIAAASGASGVHVGQDDLAPADARRCLGRTGMIGLSTHDVRQVEAALMQLVSYVAIGPVYTTATKATGYDGLGLEAVRRAAAITAQAGIPLVAIGGITIDRAPDVRNAGADSIAVISDLLDGSDLGAVEARARAWLRRLD